MEDLLLINILILSAIKGNLKVKNEISVKMKRTVYNGIKKQENQL
jgi:hypothetical protein